MAGKPVGEDMRRSDEDQKKRSLECEEGEVQTDSHTIATFKA
jgi:hypothetical protein